MRAAVPRWLPRGATRRTRAAGENTPEGEATRQAQPQGELMPFPVASRQRDLCVQQWQAKLLQVGTGHFQHAAVLVQGERAHFPRVLFRDLPNARRARCSACEAKIARGGQRQDCFNARALLWRPRELSGMRAEGAVRARQGEVRAKPAPAAQAPSESCAQLARFRAGPVPEPCASPSGKSPSPPSSWDLPPSRAPAWDLSMPRVTPPPRSPVPTMRSLACAHDEQRLGRPSRKTPAAHAGSCRHRPAHMSTLKRLRGAV